MHDTDDPHRSQQVFRQLLEAMSRPGLRQTMPVAVDSAREAALLAGRTLLDQEVSFAVVGPQEADGALADALRAATRARPAELAEARYVFVPGGDGGDTLERVHRGTPAYPDRGATVLYLLGAEAAGGAAEAITLRGPGIDGSRAPELDGLSAAEWRRLREANGEFPLGVDVVCLSGRGGIMAVPRSTRISIR